jgi:glycosyltransferase involved in cell wall biosynthesis
MKDMRKLEVAVIVPCYNEEVAVEKVVKDFLKALPYATVHVFDNNSKDKTAVVAQQAGATVHSVKLPGKGNVVRRMFADVDADIYLMVDGDATYDAASAPLLVNALVEQNLDMVVGCRVEESTENKNYRPGHRLGNKMLTGTVQRMFGGNFSDMLSGYRAFSRRFAKSFPAASNGFEIETELTVFALEMKLPYAEVATPYYERVEGSESKLSTYKDGIRIVKMILRLHSNERPARFWGTLGAFLFAIAIIVMIPVIAEYLRTHEVQRFPTVIVASAIALGGLLSFMIGIVLRTVTAGRNEGKHLTYLSIPAVRNASDK